MMRVKELSSYDELIETLNRCEQEANAAVKAWQEQLAIGDYFIRLYGFAGGILPIFCAIEPFRYKEDREEYERAHLRLHRFVHAYSSVCNEGEYGDTHVAVAWKQISKEMFEEAKARNWSAEIIKQWINSGRLIVEE